MSSSRKMISIVIPAFNEEASVGPLHAEIVKVMEGLPTSFEIIFVDDGSTDRTFETLKTLYPATIVRFRRNFGQTAALAAGIAHARGDYVVTMDADGQNDPADIPKLLSALEKDNLDVVSGWRIRRRDPLLKRMSSRVAALVRRVLINDGIHDSGCTLKMYRKECFDRLELSGEMHRFIPGLLTVRGFSIGEISVNHRPRRAGKTKYTWTRGIRAILDMGSVWFWKRYAGRPLHLFGAMGLVLVLLSFMSGVLALYGKVFRGEDLSDTALTIFTMFAFLVGMQFVVFGLIADIASKNYFAARKETVYDIKDVVENT